MYLGRTGSGFPTSLSLLDLARFVDYYNSSREGGQVSRPPRSSEGRGRVSDLHTLSIGDDQVSWPPHLDNDCKRRGRGLIIAKAWRSGNPTSTFARGMEVEKPDPRLRRGEEVGKPNPHLCPRHGDRETLPPILPKPWQSTNSTKSGRYREVEKPNPIRPRCIPRRYERLKHDELDASNKLDVRPNQR